MDIPGWVFMIVGTIVTGMSAIIYAQTKTFQLFIFIGVAFITYGVYKLIIDRVVKKQEADFNRDLAQYKKETKLSDLPVGQKLYYQQHYSQGRNPAHAHPQPRTRPMTEFEQHQAHMRRMYGQAQNRQPETQHRQPVQPQARYAYCPRCGAASAANFCGNCGTRVR
jgi:hypothetical protein